MNDTDLPALGARELERATSQLREQPTALPVEVAGRVLRLALATPRPAELVRAVGDHAFLRVSTTVVTALVRARLDAEVADGAVRRVRCRTGRGERLEGVTVELVVRYGSDVREVARATHDQVADVLADLFGADVAVHVHVGDVVQGDPRVVDPFDESRA